MPKALEAQRDFSAGEIDASAKRSDQSPDIAPLLKAGLRQAANTRILNTKALQNRPGRRALFLAANRTDEIVVTGTTFYLNFVPGGGGTLNIINAAGAQIFAQGALGFTSANIPLATIAVIGNSVYIATTAFQPVVLTWSGSAWSLALFAEAVVAGGQKRTPFYRISPQNITMQPAATFGLVTIQFSAPILVAGMIGTRMRYCGRQIVITEIASSVTGTAAVIEPLPPAQQLTLSNNVGIFNVGDSVEGATSGAAGIITLNTLSAGGQQTITVTGFPFGPGSVGVQITGSSSGATGHIISVSAPTLVVSLDTSTLFVNAETLTFVGGSATITSVAGGGTTAALIVQLLQSSGAVRTFSATEIVVGPSGSATTSAVATKAPQAVLDWDDEVMNPFRGYPSACFADQNRIGFCGFPSVPRGISWSAIGSPTDLYPGAFPGDPMFELAPAPVLFVQPGMEGSEFVLCTTAIYYIPITPANPLKPGSVSFNQLSQHGAAQVVPRSAEQSIIYVKAGGTQIGAIQVPGTYNRPYVIDNISELHAHLLRNPFAIAIPSGSTQFEENYLYVLNGDGTLAVGKYLMKNGLLDAGPDGKPHVGWVPWSGAGVVTWVAALGSDVLFTTGYSGFNVVEVLDNTQYLDSALLVNSLPAPFTPPGGKGPLYAFPGPNASVSLMDQGTRMMGIYQTDANGFIVPQNNGGENLAAATLTAGLAWSAIVEPFIPGVPPGPDQHQRRTRRRISSFGAHVAQSSGFYFAKIASRIGPLLPPVGTVTILRRVPTWNQDDDPTRPPPLRETSHNTRPSGRDYDPRAAIIKDSPGPLQILEITAEAST